MFIRHENFTVPSWRLELFPLVLRSASRTWRTWSIFLWARRRPFSWWRTSSSRPPRGTSTQEMLSRSASSPRKAFEKRSCHSGKTEMPNLACFSFSPVASFKSAVLFIFLLKNKCVTNITIVFLFFNSEFCLFEKNYFVKFMFAYIDSARSWADPQAWTTDFHLIYC